MKSVFQILVSIMYVVLMTDTTFNISMKQYNIKKKMYLTWLVSPT